MSSRDSERLILSECLSNWKRKGVIALVIGTVAFLLMYHQVLMDISVDTTFTEWLLLAWTFVMCQTGGICIVCFWSLISSLVSICDDMDSVASQLSHTESSTDTSQMPTENTGPTSSIAL